MSTARAGLRTFGVDEAGRGPILGPMAIAVVATDLRGTRALTRCGVADSKSFGHGERAIERRCELAAVIRETAVAVRVRMVDAGEIDRNVREGRLNALERRVARELLESIGVVERERIVCDGATLFGPLRARFPGLSAVDNGEQAHVAVAAASIVAKDARDAAFAVIAARYEDEFGPVRGGGYLNAATHRFLAAYRERYGDLPPEARRSWGAAKEDANLSLF